MIVPEAPAKGEKAENEGKYRASGTVNKAGTSICLKKRAIKCCKKKEEIYPYPFLRNQNLVSLLVVPLKPTAIA